MEPLFMKPVFQEKFGAAAVCVLFSVLTFLTIKLAKIGQSVPIPMESA